MNIISPMLFIGAAIGIALFAGTIRTIKQNLIRRPADQTNVLGIGLCSTIEWLLWIFFLLAMVAAAPHPTTVLLAVLLMVSVITASRLRYIEEAASLNRWLKLSASRSTPLSDLVEGLANGCRSHLAGQAKKFVQRIDRGVSIMDASRQANLPLDADTIAALIYPSTTTASETPSTETRSTSIDRPTKPSESAQLVRNFRGSFASRTSLSMTLSFQQFAYGVATVFLAWTLGALVRKLIVPMLRQIRDIGEFDTQTKLLDGPLDWTVFAGDVVLVALVVWLVTAFVIEAMPVWSLRWIPWFGRRAIDQWRCELLGALQRGTRAGHPADQIFNFAQAATRSRWVRRCCRKARASLDSGDPLPVAMRRANLITTPQQHWMIMAQSNGNLPGAIEQLSSSIERQQTFRWKRRMAWAIPVTLLAVGFYVLIHAVYVFQFLTQLIIGNS